MPPDAPIAFDNSYARLPTQFHSKTQPATVPEPTLVRVNGSVARELKIDPDWLRSPDGIAMLAGNHVPENADPLAQAYAGHQFGGWSPVLGDGRAILLGEVIDTNGKRRDIQLKGSGLTPFSRRGDGKATLGSVIREYIVSEAMTALNVPSTRALAAVTTGERVPRMRIHPGGVFTRIAASHLRVGTFQYFLGQQDIESIKTLADYAIERHYPEAAESENPYLELLKHAGQNQAILIAKWMQLGFIHGVMNTDNMAISGETIDFGPCAFVEEFHPDTVFSSIDHQGRYSWANQPNIGYWNLERLGDALAPLIADDMNVAKKEIETALDDSYLATFKDAHFSGFGKKLGLTTIEEKERTFIASTLQFMAERKIDFTLFFRQLTRVATGSASLADLKNELSDPDKLDAWFADWETHSAKSGDQRAAVMQASNPILIPRNHRVEQAIQAAETGDLAPFHRLVDALENPFTEDSQYSDLESPATPEEAVCETFCGT